MLQSFPKVIKTILKPLPRNDYPVLSTFSFVSCWLEYVMDKSVVSMQDLFKRLNTQGIDLKISNFSKASKKRDTQVFLDIINQLKRKLRQRKGERKARSYFPIDSTILSLTSKLLCSQGYHQVKLFCGLDNWTSETGGIVIHFGQGHDYKYGHQTVNAIPENGVGIMDRGFASCERIRELKEQQNKAFVLRIKNNVTLERLDDGNSKVGKDEREVEIRVVAFCDLEDRTEFRLATNLPFDGEEGVSNEEIAEIYVQRWQIELLWKFLKMHLKLDRLMTKNENGIRIQIYSCLIAYLILQLIEIPLEFGKTILDKLRYLQAYMCQEISYVHWFRKLIWLR
ncbi:IS4 family transposase [Cyanothece sp. BG0011]|uniref:IS4 family transposase n=1 Tax=Cyanothece sp. BG0011 TaxID=2082950 RepID=UPI000D1E9968|nr:IS4 family transposase [Cyanothece sp. BG0011]